MAMVKVLVVHAQHSPWSAGMEFTIGDRLSWMRYIGFGPGSVIPDEITLHHFHNRMTTSGTL